MTNPPILTPEFVIYDPLCSRCRKLAGRDAAGVPPDAALCVGHLRRRAAEDAATIARLREAHVEQMRPPRARRPRKVAPDLWAQVPPEILDKMNELLAENSRLKRLYALSRQAMAKCRTCRRRGLRQSPREGTDLQR